MNARLSRLLKIGLVGVLAVAAVTAAAIAVLPRVQNKAQQISYQRLPRASGADWSSYLMDGENTGFNANETVLSPQTISRLGLLGMYDVGANRPEQDAIGTSVVSIGNTLYFGSWDGYEYAVDATTYALRWRQYLGVTAPPAADQCFPLFAGVSSNATVVGDNLYVGGGAGALFDLDTETGTIIWQTQLAMPPTEYLWGAPAVGNGHIYIGVASYGNCPQIPGRLDMLDPTTGRLLIAHFNSVGRQPGGTVWSKPVLDAADHAVIFGTGNGPIGKGSQAVMALNWDTLDELPQGKWSLPVSETGGDSDFGASCVLVPDVGGGAHGVVCHNKNGHLYALKVSQMGLSLSWSLRLGYGGDSPEHDVGDIVSAVFDGQYLYTATETLLYDGKRYTSALYKINPRNGAVIWVTPVSDFFSVNALAGANGLLVMGETDQAGRGGFVIVSMASGETLYSQILSGSVWVAPTIANGEIYVPTLDGHLYVYGLIPLPSGASVLSGPHVSSSWQWLSYHASQVANTAQGLAITATAHSTVDDANVLVSGLPVGDYEIETQVVSPLANGDAHAGVVAYAAAGDMVVLSVFSRAPNRQTTELDNYFQGHRVGQSLIDEPTAGAGPLDLQLVRLGNRYLAYSSRDGVHWLKIGDITVPFSTNLGGVVAYAPINAMPAPATFAYCQIRPLNG